MRILLVEDNLDHQELMSLALTGHDPTWQVEGVVSGEEGLRRLAEGEAYDLVFLDYSLPGRDGLEVLKETRLGEAPPPVVMVTGRGDEQVAVEAMKGGAYDYVTKVEGYLQRLPVVAQRAVEAYRLAVERKQAEEALRESEQRLKEAQAMGRIGNWEFDIDSRTINWSDQVFKLYERDPAPGPPTPEEEATYYTPEQAKILREYARCAIETGEEFKYDLEAKLPSGRPAHFSASMRPIKDKSGRVVRLFGTVQDITERKRTEEALRESETKFRTIYETANAIIMAHDRDFKVVYMNPYACQVLGYEVGEMIGKDIRPMLEKSEYERAEPVRQLVTIDPDMQVEAFEQYYLKKGGGRVLINWNVTALKDADGNAVGILGVGQDITEHKRAEEERASLARFPGENPNPVMRLSQDGLVLYANEASQSLLHEWGSAVGGYAPDFWRDLAANALANRSSQTVDVRHGEQVLSFFVAPIADAGYVNLYGRDITERKRAQEALAQERILLRTVIDNLPDAIYVKDAATRKVLANRADLENIGKPEAEVLGKTDWDVFPAEVASHFYADDQAVLQKGQAVINREELLVNVSGQSRWLLTSKLPLRDSDGRITGIVGIGRDITERKRAEEVLAQERNLLRTLIDNLPDVVYVKDAESRFVIGNFGLARQLGATTPEEVIGKSDFDYHPRELATRYYADEQEILHSGQSLLNREEPVLDRSIGELSWYLTTKVPLRDREGKMVGLVGIGRDITERKRAEQVLRQYAARLETMHEIDQVTLAAQPVEVIARTVLRGLRRLVPYWLASVVLFDAEAGEVTVVAVHAEGETKLCAGARFPSEVFRIPELQQGRPHVVEDIRNLPQLPPELQALQAEGMRSFVNIPLLVEDRPIGMLNLGADHIGAFPAEQLAIAREITDQLAIAIQQTRLREQVQRHTAELEQRVAERTAELTAVNRSLQAANERLKELDRLKSQFVSNVSHELRTPLTNIKMYLWLLERGKPEKRVQYMATLNRETDLLQRLIEDLLDLSRLDQGRARFDLVPVDVNRLVAMLVDARGLLVSERGLSLEVQTASDLPPVLADANMLMQVLTNLIANAVNYTPAGGRIVVSSGLQRSDGQTWIILAVRDTGLGITSKDQAHIFERFYRGEAARQTKVAGTGLGLSICQEIVQRHSGRIWVESAGEGQGSTFYVALPVSPAE